MFRLIINNLWHRRLRYGWLLAELILVTIVSWVILDPVVVFTYDVNRPLGYDADRLCLIEITELTQHARGYDSTRTAQNDEDMMALLHHVRQHPMVESATLLRNGFFIAGNNETNCTFELNDSDFIYIANLNFIPNSDFFTTYGFKSADGTTDVADLDKMAFGASDIIVTKSVASVLFPDDNPIGKEITTKDYGYGTKTYRIVGTIDNVQPRSYLRQNMAMFSVGNNDDRVEPHLLVKIRQNTRMNSFLSDFRPWMTSNLKSGNLFCRTIQPYEQHIANEQYTCGGNNVLLMKLLALFFLINLALGVTGTFWLQTRTRCQDVGIMRSFGATPSKIRIMLMAEGALITFIAWIIGCIIYLQWAIHNGLSLGHDMQWTTKFDTGWICSFWPHFLGVSAIVLALMLIVVMLGVWLPARKLSRTDPVTVLHEN